MPIRIRYFQSASEIVPVVNEEEGWIPQPTAQIPYFLLPQISDDGRGGAGAFEDYWLQLAQPDYGTQTVRAFGEDFAEGNNPPPPGQVGPEIVGVHVSPSAHGSYRLVGVRM